VKGFRAFLAHKFGGSIRGWRRAVAPDEVGVAPVLFSDFCFAMRELGWSGNAMSLWKALSNGKDSVGIQDLEPNVALGLDRLSVAIFKRYKGGVQDAWKDMDHEHGLRLTFCEFDEFLDNKDFIPAVAGGWVVPMRRLFEAIDMSGRGSLTLEDLRFIDRWAHLRVHVPLPPDLRLDSRDVADPEPWAPPPVKPPPDPSIADFRAFLEKRFGSASRAWRIALDLKGTGSVSISDLGKGCRSVGWKHDHSQMFRLLKEAGQGLARLRSLDPETAKAIDRFKEEAVSRYDGLQDLWAELLDPGSTGTVSRTEFVRDVAVELEMREADAMRVFNALDTAGTGWVANSELGFLETFESGMEAKYAAAAAYERQKTLQLSQAFPQWGPQGASSEPASSSGAKTTFNPGSGSGEDAMDLTIGSLGRFRPPWQDVQLAATGISSGIKSAASPLGRELYAPHKSSRSFQYRALANANQLKHRWLALAAEDRCIYSNHETVVADRKVMSQALKKGSSGDIFRTSSEFYRLGVDRLLQKDASRSLLGSHQETEEFCESFHET
ncbi:unnamed protein product, partial [Polarella glacialis]